MALEDFERELAQEAEQRKHTKRSRSTSRSPNRRDPDRHHHKRHHHHRHHRSSRHDDDSRHGTHASDRHRHRRSRRSDDEEESGHRRRRRQEPPSATIEREDDDAEEDVWVEKQPTTVALTQDANASADEGSKPAPKRDAWMEQPSALDIDYVQRKQRKSPPPQHVRATEQQAPLQIHDNELNQRLRETPKEDEGNRVPDDKPAQHEVDYTFGDAGSSWRMTKLRAVFSQAKQSGRPVEDIAVERYGDLRSFDDAREEEVELDRRKTYGDGYVGKEKPSGEFFQERKLDSNIRRASPSAEESEDEFEAAQGEVMTEESPPGTTVSLDQLDETALDRIRAKMMKAFRNPDPELERLLSELKADVDAREDKNKSPPATTVSLDQSDKTALNRLKARIMKGLRNPDSELEQLLSELKADVDAREKNKQADVVVLNQMESRMLAGGRKGEVKSIDNKRGRERGLVEENEEMSIDDMVRQERRTKGQYGNEGRAFAERIAKDAKFDNDLDYMDENAAKLSKSVQKSDVNLRNTAISDYQKMKHILDTCPLCHHEDTSTPPQAPLVSLATRVYLTLPTSPEITPYGLCTSIIPIQHRVNLLECDDDEWEEIRNFMKSLSRYYYAQNPPLTVIFYENAAHEGRKRHASMEAVPLPMKYADTISQYFRESILSSDEEWTQHQKIIDTQEKATTGGLGKLAFRRSMVSELPYFHVWFTLDGGLGHVVEDSRRWPKGDLFAREILGGILDVGPDVIKRQGRWRKGDAEMEKRVQRLKKGWDKFDWTHVLMDAQ